MTIRAGILTSLLLGLVLLLSTAVGEPADEPIALTPPRLSYVEGETSFWRPGAEQWAAAQVNTPLAAGDEMSTGHRGNLELQVGAQAFVRAWGNTRLGLAELAPDLLRVTVTTGHVALDARSLQPGRSIEIGTPHAAFTIDTPGYYRVDVAPERTALASRGAGRGTITTAGGASIVIGPGEQVTLDGATVQRLAAPPLDVWDTWNQTRSDQLLVAASQRYLAPEVYGAAELDQYGAWRTEPSYGAVWVPRAVPVGWAPYTSGRWVADPYYGWTWVDTAPWGWAPYHYGRWVHLGGVWAWAPGPIVARPVYAPALVAFFGAPGVRVSVGSPFVSWVALGWGEPVVPWWGPARFVGRPWWGGWGGPRVVHRVHDVTVYRNTRVRHAVVAVRGDTFGRRPVHETRVADVDVRQLHPVRGRLPVNADRPSLGPGVKPPADRPARPIVTRRPPSDGRDDRRERGATPPTATPVPRAVPPSASPRAEQPRRPQPINPVVPPNRPEPAVPGTQRGQPERRGGERGAVPPVSPRGREVMPAPRQSAQPQPPAQPRPAARVERSPERREPAARPPAPAGFDRSRPRGPAAPAIERRGPSEPADSPARRQPAGRGRSASEP